MKKKMNDLEKRQHNQDMLLYTIAKAEIKDRYKKAKKDYDNLQECERKAGLPE